MQIVVSALLQIEWKQENFPCPVKHHADFQYFLLMHLTSLSLNSGGLEIIYIKK